MKRFVSRIVSGAVMLGITFAGIPAVAQTSSPEDSLKTYNVYADLNQNGKARCGRCPGDSSGLGGEKSLLRRAEKRGRSQRRRQYNGGRRTA